MTRKTSIVLICIAMFLAVTGFTVRKKVIPLPLKNSFLEPVKIKVELDKNGMQQGLPAFMITDTKMISDIVSMIRNAKIVVDKTKYNHMSGMATRDNELTIYLKKGSEVKVTYAYDDPTFGLGYVIVGGKQYDPGYDFFRYMNGLLEYRKFDTKMDNQSVALFHKYKWTLDYRVNTVKQKLPVNLKYDAGEYPTKLYWAYNNVLSSSIGLDYTGFLGKTVDVSIYRIHESLPQSLRPRMNARGIIIKYNGKIIGAYIDAGRHDCFGCALNRKIFTEISGKSWDKWVDDHINYQNPLMKKLAVMTPQQVIDEYFKAMDQKDEIGMFACMSTRSIADYLGMNMDNNKLFNESYKDACLGTYNNVLSAKLIKIGEKMQMDNPAGMVEYAADVDLQFVKEITSSSGRQTRFIILKKETEKSGWRIASIGTGP